MEFNNMLGGLSGGGCSPFGSGNDGCSWIFILLILFCCGDGSLLGFGCNKKHKHHRKGNCCGLLGSDTLVLLLVIFVLCGCGSSNKEPVCCCNN